MAIKIPKVFVKLFLFIIQNINDNHIALVCKGYNEEYDNYTALYWNDDKDLDLKDETYRDFQIWLSPKYSTNHI